MGLIFAVTELGIFFMQKVLIKICHLLFLRVGGEGYEKEKRSVSCWYISKEGYFDN